MFGIIADFFSSIITILLPIFASYKALRTSDPAQLTPWLMYWVILSLVLLAESWTVFILGWIPFYSWIRLGLLSYLVLPQTQGARMLYQEYVDPFLTTHEHDIDVFIGNAHARARQAGLQYVKQLIEIIRERVLGLPPQQKSDTSAQPTTTAGYAQSLFARFNLPSARDGLVAPAGDFYGMLSSAVTAATSSGKSREMQAEELSASGNLIPGHISSNSEKMDYLASQREKLGVLMSALDREQSNLSPITGKERSIEEDIDRRTLGSEGDSMKKSRSDLSFEAISHEDARNGRQEAQRSGSGGWGGWIGTMQDTVSQAKSTGFDAGH